MADAEWDKIGGRGNSDVYEVALDATDSTTTVQDLDPKKATTIAIKTTGSATVQVDLLLESPDNSGLTWFTFVSAAATASSVDYIKSALGPITAIDLTGTISGSDTATIQVVQSERD